MIHLGESCSHVNRVWIDSCDDRRSLISDRRKPRVNDGDVCWRNRDQAGLVQATLLEISKIEGAVSNNGTAYGCAELSLSHRKCGVSQSVRGIETLITEEAVKIA